ncbi:MAG TPA: FAD/NAD(P)-binding oxidoreductase [Actinospica sp.]|nr:FAD/NAD(P)-binding oxidoreductase [Actinospica sp.]
MTKRIVILGGGTGGTLVANRLRHTLSPREAEIVVVDLDDDYIDQGGLIFAPFAPFTQATRHKLIRSRGHRLHSGIEFRRALVDHVEIARNRVLLDNCRWLEYDVLIVATGARLTPERTEGLIYDGWGVRVHTFYTLHGAEMLSAALRRFEGGRIAVNVVDLPIKYPVAPVEFCFLADTYFRHRGMRERVELTYVTPLDGALTASDASRALDGLLRDKGVGLVTGFRTAEVDGTSGRLTSGDGRAVDFDLAVVVPSHAGAAYVGRSPGLGDERGFVRVDPRTLRSLAKPNVFALGDAADTPTWKAGSAIQAEGETVERNVVAHLDGRPLPGRFDGHADCLVDTGSGRAVLLDVDYATGPRVLAAHSRWPQRLHLGATAGRH